jgi:hypothetical protein
MSTIAERILQENDLRRELVPTPEWPGVDGEVWARCLSGDELDQWEIFLSANTDKESEQFRADVKNVRAKLVALGACDRDGQPIFTAQQVLALGRKNGVALDRLHDIILRLSGRRNRDAEKNSGATDGDASSSV